MFPGDSEIDQLFRIFRSLGTPDDRCWPGVTKLPDYKCTFPRWDAPDQLSEQLVAGMTRLQLQLLSAMLRYDPSQRVSAKVALTHAYFADVCVVRPDRCGGSGDDGGGRRHGNGIDRSAR